MLENYQVRPLSAFGLKIEAPTAETFLTDLPIPALRELVRQHRVLVLRGFAALDGEAFRAYAEMWGELLLWKFGAILDVVVEGDAQNYLFTHGSVPHHWDGAFAQSAPHLQIFQCLAAPGDSDYSDEGAGGETVFCDTTRVWNAASPEQRARWAATAVTYRTDQLAHYGGELCANLVSRHPLTGETTLRFAEPPDADTSPLNPVTLEVHGATLEELMVTLQPQLYAPANCSVHEWQEGDFVIADNHALLHARKAFAVGASRHLQRIHVK